MRRLQILCGQIVEVVLNKHERGVGYPGATIKIPFSATLDYYNRRGQLYTKPVTKLAEYLLTRTQESNPFTVV
jgi:hypothetical protein